MSYSGTTWINCILASAPGGFMLGAPQRIYELEPQDARKACHVHARNCTFWPSFVRDWDRRRSFLEQLFDHCHSSAIILNNPTATFAERELESGSIDQHEIFVARDGRAILTSLLRHHTDEYSGVYDALQRWLLPALLQWQRLHSISMATSEAPAEERQGLKQVTFVRYEEVADDPLAWLHQVGTQIGLEFVENSVRWWTHDHHLTSGNAGVIDLLRRAQGLRPLRHAARARYEEHFRAQQDDDLTVMQDLSWQRLLGERDRFLFDYICGPINEELGYERDRWTTAEAEALRARLRLPANAKERPERLEVPDRDLERFRQERSRWGSALRRLRPGSR